MNAAIQPTTDSYTIAGREVRIPVAVRDSTSITAMFLVQSEPVRRLIPDPRLHVAEVLPGRTVCVVGGVQYRDNDLGQYNEIVISFFVKFGGPRPMPLFGVIAALRRGEIGSYIHRLPVTTEFSRAAGHDIWGFPKTVEKIDFHAGDKGIECALRMSGAHVLTLAAPPTGKSRMPETPQSAFAWSDGLLYRTRSIMSGEGVANRPRAGTLTLGNHAVADELRSLGLPKRPLFCTSIQSMRANFMAPETV